MKFVLFLSLLLCYPLVALCAAVPKCQRGFRVAAVLNEPLYYFDKSNQKKGVALEVISELRKRTGCDFVIVELSRPSVVERLRGSSIDITVVSIRTTAMDDVAKFIPAYSSYRALVLSKELRDRKYDLSTALQDKAVIFGNVIGTQSYYQTKEIKMLLAAKRMREYPDYASLYQALLGGQISAVLSSLVAADYFVSKDNMKQFRMTIDKSARRDVGTYYADKRLRPEEVKMFTQVFADMVRDGSFAKIYKRYISELATKNAILVN